MQVFNETVQKKYIHGGQYAKQLLRFGESQLAHGANLESDFLDRSLPLKHLFRTSKESQR